MPAMFKTSTSRPKKHHDWTKTRASSLLKWEKSPVMISWGSIPTRWGDSRWGSRNEESTVRSRQNTKQRRRQITETITLRDPEITMGEPRDST
ncbi:hypothetical protein VTN77DRAFT_1613 [Rasamsonia byssochlamydoides]|uniref:uncharacterized protein n=1 Tax=Rasamsonia byssochlamydoides TaxID=89139 RepID=UPI0037421F55